MYSWRAEQMNEGHPQKSQHHHGARSDAPKGHQLLFARRGPELFIKVERNHRRSGIENGAHRAHQGGQQRGDQPIPPGRLGKDL